MNKIFIFLLFIGFACYGQEKMKGVSFVGSSEPIDSLDIMPVVSLNANWVTLMPYGFIGEDHKIQFNSQWQWWGEKDEGIIKTIALCRDQGLQIMLKPQIWIMNGYTGDFSCGNSKSWENFEDSYHKFILHFAKIAQEQKVEMFCVGTEWRTFIAQRDTFWKRLIPCIRTAYEGKLTYASNWDDYESVPFWNQMDFIGINGYFPVSINKNPSIQELTAGWEIHSKKLSKFSKKYDKKIIFTEIGYRSMIGATLKPWEHSSRKKASPTIQKRAFEALFEVIWEKDWFAGLFIWKWYHNHENQGGANNIDFTPQNKMAETYIRSFWG
jgi:hypothetical protein